MAPRPAACHRGRAGREDAAYLRRRDDDSQVESCRMRGSRYPLALLVIGIILLAATAVNAYSLGTWTMEVFPIFIAVPILIATWRRFPLTPLVYALIFIHACILMVGGHYTYARVPFGFWMQRTFHFARNHYDRIG